MAFPVLLKKVTLVRKLLESNVLKLGGRERLGPPNEPASLGGAEIHLAHLGAGHTDGDVLVGIPAQKFMHLGDIFFNGFLPYVDTAAGGSLEGILANVETVLSFLPEGSKLIPGHGPVGSNKELARYRDFLRAALAHVKANPGKRGKDLEAGFDRAAWSDIKPMGSFLTWERFFDIVSASTSK